MKHYTDVKKLNPMPWFKWFPRLLVNFEKQSTVQNRLSLLGKEEVGNREEDTCPLDLYPLSKSEIDLWLNLVIKSLSLTPLSTQTTTLYTKLYVIVVHALLKRLQGGKVAGVSVHSQLATVLWPRVVRRKHSGRKWWRELLTSQQPESRASRKWPRSHTLHRWHTSATTTSS